MANPSSSTLGIAVTNGASSASASASASASSASASASAALPRWPKSCGCGETWSREHWGELTPVGRYQADEWIELRTCVCGKTLAVPTSDLDAR